MYKGSDVQDGAAQPLSPKAEGLKRLFFGGLQARLEGIKPAQAVETPVLNCRLSDSPALLPDCLNLKHGFCSQTGRHLEKTCPNQPVLDAKGLSGQHTS